MKKISGFTMIELIIVLLISGLVIGMGASFLSFVNQKYLILRNVNDLLIDSNKLSAIISNDIFKSDLLVVQSGCIFTIINSDSIIYKFNAESTIRIQNGESDTLNLGSTIQNCYMNNEIVEKDGVIDEFVLSCNIDKVPIRLHFYKQYDSCKLIKYI